MVNRACLRCLAYMAMCTVASAAPPAEVLDLSCWKLTLPIAAAGKSTAAEIEQPELATFADEQYFFTNADGDAVIFRAPCGGATTKNSSYPRSELREMSPGGDESAWSTDDETPHTLEAELAVTATPRRKQHVVCLQIHDEKDDVLMLRLEGTKLFIERGETERVMLDREYQLGTKFTFKIAAGGGRIRAWYNGVAVMDWENSVSLCYYKAGCYTQSNVDRGDAPDDYGEVAIYRLTLGR